MGSAFSLLPGLLVGPRDALEHVAQLVTAGDRLELADLLAVDGVVAHALDDRHNRPAVGRDLDHAVGQRRALGLVELRAQGTGGLDVVLADLTAVVLVAQQALDTLGREGAVVAPRRVGPAGRAVHRGPADEPRLVAALHGAERAPFVVLERDLDTDF